MIPILNIEDLTVEDVNKLIERGVVFDITSRQSNKPSLLRRDVNNKERDTFWGNGDKSTTYLR